MKQSPRPREPMILLVMSIMLILIIVFSFILGRYSISIEDLIKTIFSPLTGAEVSNTLKNIVFQVRFPRILIGIIIGSGLSISGAAYQGVFRNPMVSPDLLGASAGAGFGAAIALVFSLNHMGIQFTAFVFGMLAVLMSYGISAAISRDSNNILSLVLTGMVINALFQAFISIVKYLADPYSTLPSITFWLMGGLASTVTSDIPVLLIPVLLGSLPLFLLRWRINTLSFGDKEARMLGINPRQMRIVIIICSTLITSACVSIGGMISWVGLVIPHLARMMIGPNYKYLIPASCLLGGAFLLVVDDVARSLIASEIPLSILTAIIGAPFFIYLLFRGRKSWL